MKNNKPEDNILESIVTPELEDITKEVLELGIDEITKNEIIKKVPILNLVLAGYKTIISVRDYQFMKKIIYFLCEQTKITQKERDLWLNKYRKSEDAQKIGELTIELIDKINSVRKAKILGILFRYQIQGQISTQEFIRIAEMINAIYSDDLDYFLKTDEVSLGELGDEVDHLLSAGFLSRGGYSMGGKQYFPNKKPQHSDYGKLVFKILKKEF